MPPAVAFSHSAHESAASADADDARAEESEKECSERDSLLEVKEDSRSSQEPLTVVSERTETASRIVFGTHGTRHTYALSLSLNST